MAREHLEHNLQIQENWWLTIADSMGRLRKLVEQGTPHSQLLLEGSST